MNLSVEYSCGYILCFILAYVINGICCHKIEIASSLTQVEITEPFNISCHYTDNPTKNIIYAELARFGGTKDRRDGTSIMKNGMLLEEFEKEKYTRYSSSFPHVKGHNFTQNFFIKAAFKEDKGEYRCILYLMADSSYGDTDSKSLRINVFGNMSEEESYKIEHAPTTTTTTTTTTPPSTLPRVAPIMLRDSPVELAEDWVIDYPEMNFTAISLDDFPGNEIFHDASETPINNYNDEPKHSSLVSNGNVLNLHWCALIFHLLCGYILCK